MSLAPLPANPFRAIAFARPKGPARPRPFELAVSRIEEGLARLRAGDHILWKKLATETPVYGAAGQRKDRKRRLRSDGARNYATLMEALVFSSDPRGFLASPTNGAWVRPLVRLLDFRAYGDQVPNERSIRRTERWLRVMVDLGFMTSGEIVKEISPGVYRSAPAARKLTPTFWKLLGVWGAMRQLQKERDREAGRELAKKLEKHVTPARRRFVVRTGKPTTEPAPTPGPPRPPPAAPPEPRRTAVAASAAVADIFKDLESRLFPK